MSKPIVIYFSRGDEEYGVGEVHPGNTELLAHAIIEKVSADEFKIVPEVPYPKDYMICVDLATKERNDNARPSYRGDVNLVGYDTVYLGYPIWWGDLPMIVYHFLEDHASALVGKTIVPFNTHEGSGNAGTFATIKNLLPEANVIGGGFNMTGTSARTPAGIEQLNTWLDSLNTNS